MIKRIIFDLDNTLIMWKDDYLDAIKKITKEYDIKDNYKYISSIIDEYDNEFRYYDKELLVNFINSKIESKIDINYLNSFLEAFGYMSDIDNNVIEVLEYLSKKYELIVLTNWFREPQLNRLKHAKIDKYFKEVIGGEECIKPNKKAFIKACSKYKPNECLMIGDDLKKDIEGAEKAGLQVIYFNYKHKENNNNYKEIDNLKDLERIL